MQPLVSIIIPSYNRADLIGETLESIISQTYENWECIIVDDGSTDNSFEVFNAFKKKDNRIKFYTRPENKPKGANACRNYGLQLSKGEYVNWFDSDDLMHSQKLEIQIDSLRQTNKNFCVCQSYDFVGNIDNFKELRYKNLVSNTPFEDFLSKKIAWLTQAPIFKKHFLIDNDYYFDEDLHAGQEWELFSRILFTHNKYDVVNKPLVYLRRHEKSISGNMSNDKYWYYYLARKKIYKKFKPNLSIRAKLSLDRSFLFFFKLFLRNGEYKKAYKIWFNSLTKCKKINLIDHFRLILGFIFFIFFKRGDVFLSNVSLYN